MSIGLMVQYGVIAVLLAGCVAYTVKKLRASARDGSCAGGCDSCGSGCTPQADTRDTVKPVHFIATHR